MRRVVVKASLALSCAICLFASGLDAAEKPRLRVAAFCCDVTPPPGQPLISGDLLSRVEDPLLAKGIVLEDGNRRYVLCAVDWCVLCNSSHALFCRKIAEAAGTDISHVAVQTVHQHSAPLLNGDAEKLLRQAPNPPALVSPKFVEEVTGRLAAAVREAVGRLEPFDHVGTANVKVDRVAASRRVKVEGGKVQVRWSTCTDAGMRAMPEGYIDPFLKTITLARGDKPLVRLHYYATHPQTPYGDGHVSADVPGNARERLQRKEHVFQVYFTGCGGDVTLGKYNDGSRKAREDLTQRLLAAMETAAAATRLTPVDRLGWRSTSLLLPPRTDHDFTEAVSLANLRDPKASYGARMKAAMCAAFHQRAQTPLQLSVLEIGPARILHLPGEAMVEFQLYAQRLLPQRFVAVASYGDNATSYICTENAFAEGGYEPTDSMVSPQSEPLFKAAIRQLLGVDSPK